MRTDLIDGRAVASSILDAVKRDVDALQKTHGVEPCLAVVLVGNDPASELYVRNKALRAKDVGIRSVRLQLPHTTSEATLLETIDELNRDAGVHGILVQLPLPSHIDSASVIAAIDSAKDVDGFHVHNVGRLATGQHGLVPCTAKACVILLKQALGSLDGMRATIVGRSNIVGRPLIQLLLNENCTVRVAHSRTLDPAAECRDADIIVAAAGRPGLVRGNWVKTGATVIDVGINRVPAENGRSKVVGDVVFEEVRGVARLVTPVPGGVGPMTIACLLQNTLQAAKMQVASEGQPQQ
jgi:methylenetetrahydrofolate dehydrogenase (NADP+) / methenyltetrahydrofolate cyclohydrolase